MGNSPVPISIPGYRMGARFSRSRKIPCPRALFLFSSGCHAGSLAYLLIAAFPKLLDTDGGAHVVGISVVAAAAVGEQMKGAGMVPTNDFGFFWMDVSECVLTRSLLFM